MIRRALFALAGIICVALVGSAWWLWRDYQHFLNEPLVIPIDGILFEVKHGSSVRTIARELADLGVVKKPGYLQLAARLRGQQHQIKAGEFFIPVDTSAADLLQLLVIGQVVQHRLTLVEGWTFDEVLAAVQRQGALRHTLAGFDHDAIMEQLQLGGIHPEGRFFPDTYFFPAGTTDTSFLRRAYDRMQEVLDYEWQRRDPSVPLASPYEALILASIIEKETGRPEERKEIAGVFVRRLQRGMKLQTDPTIIYGLGDRFDGDLKRIHLSMDNPYNTYVNNGLTPTPIAMPGRAAIHAALNPSDGTSLYFVAKGDGSHYFSSSLDEHKDAVTRYQLNGSAQ
jgi:UPF0755 protein